MKYFKSRYIYILSILKRDILKNISWLLSEKLVKLGIGCIVSVSIARYLGPDQYGQLNYIISFVALFQTIAYSTDSFIVKNIVEKKELAPSFLGSVFIVRLIIGIIILFFIVVGMYFFHPQNASFSLMALFIGSTLIFQSADCIDLWFQSQYQSRKTVKIKLVSYFLSGTLKILFVYLKLPLLTFAVAMAFEYLITALFLGLSYRSLRTKTKWKFETTCIKQIFIQSWPFILGGLMVAVYTKIDQIMLRDLTSNSELGIYSVVILFSQTWHLIPIAIIPSLVPYFVESKMISEEKYLFLLSKMFKCFLVLAFTMVIATWILSPFLIDTILGKQYHSAINILRLHIFSLIFIFLDWGQSIWLINTTNMMRIKMYLSKTIGGGIFSFCLNLYFIPKYGIWGAATVYLATTAIVSLGSTLIFCPKIFFVQLGFSPKRGSVEKLTQGGN